MVVIGNSYILILKLYIRRVGVDPFNYETISKFGLKETIYANNGKVEAKGSGEGA